jgi:hypothetical protein
MDGYLGAWGMSNIYNLPVPFFSQREVTYRWKQTNLDGTTTTGITASLAWSNCNMTSLCMILHYFGIASCRRVSCDI